MRGVADTIAAISGPAEGASRCVVRLSGVDAFAIAGRMCVRDGEGAGAAWSRGVFTCTVHLAAEGADDPPLLRTLVAVMPGPRSATGEDVVEFIVPSGVARRVLARAIDVGARPAEAGEFSLRAFLHGRLTLEEAEGVAATIAAEDADGLRTARLVREGRLGRACDRLQREVLASLALLEAGIDFTEEEDVVPISAADLRARCGRWIEESSALTERTVSEESLSGVPRVVLAGPPNAGKSTLFNRLLGRARAVESSLAGTTRDALVERWHGAGATCDLVDLPGVPDDGDPFAPAVRAVIAREMAGATLCLLCARAGEHPPDPPAGVGADRVLRVATCADCGGSSGKAHTGSPSPDGALPVSARTGEGLAALSDAVAGRVASWRGAGALPAVRERHVSAIRRATSALAECADSLAGATRAVPDPEVAAESLREAVAALGTVSGRLTSDDVLGEVFARFCVGK